MRGPIENPRLTVVERAEILALAKADPNISSTELAKQYGVDRSTIKRLLAKAGFARTHGGARERAGQTGAGGGRTQVSAARMGKGTHEMVWVEALSRIYFLGLSDAQYKKLRKRYPSIEVERPSPEVRLEMIYDAIDLYYPVLQGRKTDGRDMGEDVLAIANSSISAIVADSPVEEPAVRLDVMAAIEQLATDFAVAPGTRRIGAIVEERGLARPPRGLQPSYWPEWTPEFGAVLPPELVAVSPEVLADIPAEEREEFLRQWRIESRESAAGVRRIDPEVYAKIKELEDKTAELRKQKEAERRRHLVAQMGLGPRSNPERTEDAMADALAMLLASRGYSPPRSPVGAAIRSRRPKRRRPKTRASKRDGFRRLMRMSTTSG